MKSLVGLFLCCAIVCANASGDTVKVQEVRGGALLTIQGQAKGLANELYDYLDRAGMQVRRAPEKTDLIGKNLTASEYGFVGGNYSISIQVDESSSVTLGPNDSANNRETIVITGDSAQEIFDYLSKADVPSKNSRYSLSLIGENLNCTLFAGGKYQCAFEAVQHPDWWTQ